MSVLDPVAPTTSDPKARRLMGSAYALDGATSADEARKAAGLDWEPVHAPLYVDLAAAGVGEDDEDPALVEKERAVVRSDTGEMFGVVGREHKIITNEEMFSFADTILEEAGLTWLDAQPVGGALGNGRHPFLALQLGEGVKVAGVDQVNLALLLGNGHAGNAGFVSSVLPLRVSCSNVVTASLRAGLVRYSVQHSGDVATKVEQARAALGIASAYMVEFADLADRMAAVDMGLAEFDDFLADLVPLKSDAGDRAKKTVEDTRAAFRRNWKDTLTLSDDLKTTRWGALNVVTETLDHGNLDVRKSKIPAQERRVRFVHFGAGAQMRDRAYSLLGGI